MNFTLKGNSKEKTIDFNSSRDNAFMNFILSSLYKNNKNPALPNFNSYLR